METTFSLPFSLPSGDEIENKYLLIEQEPWGKDVGKTTALQAFAGITAAIYGIDWPRTNCMGDAEGYDAKVYVYPSIIGMSFRFHITHGEYVSKGAKILIRDETVQCGFNKSVDLNYPCRARPSLQWLGRCYDFTGAIVSKPVVTIEGSRLFFSKQVYGSLRVRYTVIRYTYDVRVEERDESIENNFDSVVYCNWNGGIKWLKINPPSGYDYTKDDCGNGAWFDAYGNLILGGGGSVIIDPEEDPKPPIAPEVDRKIVIAYCEQELKSDSAD